MNLGRMINLVNLTTPYAWDDSLSVFEMIGKLVAKINELIGVLDEELEKEVSAQVAEELKDFTTERLSELLQTGELAEMIFNHIEEVAALRFNGIEQDIREITGDDGFIPLLQTDVAGVKTRVTTAESDIAALETDVTVLESDVSDLKNRPRFKEFYNTDGAVTHALNNALTYLGTNTFVYGNGHTLFDDAAPVNGKYELDCSSFIQAVLSGISYPNSKYLNSSNISDYFGRYFSPSEFTYSRMLANDLAEHAYKNGYLYYPLPDYSNVMPGDLIFLTNSDSDDFFMKVGHVMLVERIDQNGNVTIIDANTRTDVVAEIRYNLSMLQSRLATVCARFPLPDVAIQARPINTTPGEIVNSAKVNGSVIRTVTTDTDILPKKMYTLIIKASFTGDPLAYPLINLNGTVYTWAGDVKKRADGLYHVCFFAPSVPEVNKRSFTVLGAGEWINCTVSYCALYEGAVSHYNGY